MIIYDVNRYSEDAGELPETIVVPNHLESEDLETTTTNIIEFIEKSYGRKPSAFGYKSNGEMVRYRV